MISTIKKLQTVHNKHHVQLGNGLTEAAYDAFSQVFEKNSSFNVAWNNYKFQIVRHKSKDAEDQFWATETAASAFSESTLIDSTLNKGIFISLPGVVTGIGLLFTFLAILVALLDVKIVDKRFQGIDLLIQGLSGKFVSSVAALLSATIFLICEKPVFHRLSQSRRSLVAAIDDFIPKLTPTQVLSNIHHDIAEQTNAFRLFNTDLSLMLKQSFSESMGPTLERMVVTIEDLNKLLKEAEAKKQDSIKGELETLLKSLEQSLKSTLETMGDSFKESISDSAKDQFDQIVITLKDTALLLENMKAQSFQTQTDLQALINMARNSTEKQITTGQEQVEALTSVLKDLMIQLKETANSSVNDMTLKLTSVTHDLSEKVSQLGEQMAEVMQKSSTDTTTAAKEVIQKAGDWSGQNSAKLDQLIEKYQTQIELTSELKDSLTTALLGFKDSIIKYGQITTDLKQVTNDVNETVGLMTQVSSVIKENQESLKTIAALTKEQIQQLKGANQDQKDIWKEIFNSMQQYRNTFQQVENSAKELLLQISDNLNNYTEMTEENFKTLVQVSNEHFGNAVKGLAQSVGELDELLQNLNDVLHKKKD